MMAPAMMPLTKRQREILDFLNDFIQRHGYAAFGGSDSHLVTFVGVCATEFEGEIRSMDDLVRELRGGRYRPVDFRHRRAAA